MCLQKRDTNKDFQLLASCSLNLTISKNLKAFLLLYILHTHTLDLQSQEKPWVLLLSPWNICFCRVYVAWINILPLMSHSLFDSWGKENDIFSDFLCTVLTVIEWLTAKWNINTLNRAWMCHVHPGLILGGWWIILALAVCPHFLWHLS